MARYCNAIGIAICSLDTWVGQNTDLKAFEQGRPTGLGQLIDGLYESSKQLHFTSHILAFAEKVGGQVKYREVVDALARIDDFYEHLGAHLGLEALYRAEEGLDRLVPLLEALPAAAPPEMSKRFLEGAATCYLLGLDDQCIVMCRAALEVIVEELDPSLESERLGDAIRKLVPKHISSRQEQDMLEINRQAREILHRTPHRRPPSAKECLELLARLLAQLYPAHT